MQNAELQDADVKLWYKNAIIYAVDLSRFNDSDGDGRGDFKGLTEKLDYIADLGVTCLWLLPFHPSPGRDNGYDVTDHYSIQRELGTFEDFTTFLREAGKRSLRVVLDLVVDHTSSEHPWFQAARHNPNSRFRDYYVWTDDPPPVGPGQGPMFPGQQTSVWNYDELANKYYHHRFYDFEPDLNTANPEVQQEIYRIMDFWLSFGISGFRVDAANHLIEPKGIKDTRPKDPHGLLKDLRAEANQTKPSALLLGEVDEPPEQLADYFGDGDELNMMFNFVLNNYLFLALAREEAKPIKEALNQLPMPPVSCAWANFIRNLDELDLERLPEEARQEVVDRFAPDEDMKIYGRGVRRRLAPMLGGNEEQIKCVLSLLLSLPGTPVIVYGDEIGMGEDLSQKGRNTVRTPMQWSDEPNAGFSSAPEEALIQPVVGSGPFSYEKINVSDQQEEPDSLLSWFKRLVLTRRQCPELGYGSWRLIELGSPHVLAHRCMWKGGVVVAMHNLSGEEQEVTLDLSDQRGRQLKSLIGEEREHRLGKDAYEVTLDPYGFEWYRVKGKRPAE